MSKSLIPWIRKSLEALLEYDISELEEVENKQAEEGKESATSTQTSERFVRHPYTVQILKYVDEAKAFIVSDSQYTIPLYLTEHCVAQLKSLYGDDLSVIKHSMIKLNQYYFTTALQASGNINPEILKKYRAILSFPVALVCNDCDEQGGNGLSVIGSPSDINSEHLPSLRKLNHYGLYLKFSYAQFEQQAGCVPQLGYDITPIRAFNQPIDDTELADSYQKFRAIFEARVQESTQFSQEETQHSAVEPTADQDSQSKTWENFVNQYYSQNLFSSKGQEAAGEDEDGDDDSLTSLHSTGGLFIDILSAAAASQQKLPTAATSQQPQSDERPVEQTQTSSQSQPQPEETLVQTQADEPSQQLQQTQVASQEVIDPSKLQQLNDWANDWANSQLTLQSQHTAAGSAFPEPTAAQSQPEKPAEPEAVAVEPATSAPAAEPVSAPQPEPAAPSSDKDQETRKEQTEETQLPPETVDTRDTPRPAPVPVPAPQRPAGRKGATTRASKRSRSNTPTDVAGPSILSSQLTPQVPQLQQTRTIMTRSRASSVSSSQSRGEAQSVSKMEYTYETLLPPDDLSEQDEEAPHRVPNPSPAPGHHAESASSQEESEAELAGQIVIINDNDGTNQIKLRKEKKQKKNDGKSKKNKKHGAQALPAIPEHSPTSSRESPLLVPIVVVPATPPRQQQQQKQKAVDERTTDVQRVVPPGAAEEYGHGLVGRHVSQVFPADHGSAKAQKLVSGMIIEYDSPYYLVNFENHSTQRILHHELVHILVHETQQQILRDLEDEGEPARKKQKKNDAANKEKSHADQQQEQSLDITPISREVDGEAAEGRGRQSMEAMVMDVSISIDLDNELTQPQLGKASARPSLAAQQSAQHQNPIRELQSPKKPRKSLQPLGQDGVDRRDLPVQSSSSLLGLEATKSQQQPRQTKTSKPPAAQSTPATHQQHQQHQQAQEPSQSTLVSSSSSAPRQSQQVAQSHAEPITQPQTFTMSTAHSSSRPADQPHQPPHQRQSLHNNSFATSTSPSHRHPAPSSSASSAVSAENMLRCYQKHQHVFDSFKMKMLQGQQSTAARLSGNANHSQIQSNTSSNTLGHSHSHSHSLSLKSSVTRPPLPAATRRIPLRPPQPTAMTQQMILDMTLSQLKYKKRKADESAANTSGLLGLLQHHSNSHGQGQQNPNSSGKKPRL